MVTVAGSTMATPPSVTTTSEAATGAHGTRSALNVPSGPAPPPAPEASTTASGPSGSCRPACWQTQPPISDVSVSGTGAAKGAAALAMGAGACRGPPAPPGDL